MPRRTRSVEALPHPKGKARRKFILTATRSLKDVNKVLTKLKHAADVRWSPEVGERICALISIGMSIAEVCDITGMPTVGAVRVWRAERPEFDAAYEQACEARIEYWISRMFKSIEATGNSAQLLDPKTGRTMIDPARVALTKVENENIRWLLSKMYPLKYGDMTQHRHQNHEGGPLTLPRHTTLERFSDEQLDQLDQLIATAEQQHAASSAAADAAEDDPTGEVGT